MKSSTVAVVVLSVLACFVAVFLLSLLLYGLLANGKTFTGFFIQNLVICGTTALLGLLAKKRN